LKELSVLLGIHSDNNFDVVKRLLFIIIIHFFLFISLEVILRLFGVASVYSERAYGKFMTYYNFESDDTYHRWPPNKSIEYNQIEFAYSYPSNSHGFREIDFPESPSDSIEIIYVLGDSYVEGDGAPYDSTITRFLEQNFHNEGFKNVRVYNVGACGSDPVYQYKFYKNELAQTSPELVLMLTNFTDLHDIQFRGGFERFLPDGGVKFRDAPKGFLLYKYSRIARVIFHKIGYSEGMLLKKNEQECTDEINALIESFVKTDSLSRFYNTEFILLTHPAPGEKNPYLYTDGILNYLTDEKAGIKRINTANTLKSKTDGYDYMHYAWPINGHFNGYGYKLMAEAVYEDLKHHYPEIFARFTKIAE
jgi:hypothetical protein